MFNLFEHSPSVSVVMPVYNGELYLEQAINSILSQTFQDFEFVIIDDASTDQTSDIIKQFKDKRIVLYQNRSNIGNYASRNIGMKLARGRYVCVMDADDVALPMRLQRQLAYMEANPKVGICGSFIQLIPSGWGCNFETNEDLLKVMFLSNNYCSHPSLIIRKKFIHRFNLWYNEDYYYSADFDLGTRGFQHFRVQNIPYILLQYRRHSEQISTAKFAEQQKYADLIRIRQLTDNLGFKTNEIPIELHLQLMKRYPMDVNNTKLAEEWIRAILEKNKDCCQYKENLLSGFLNQLLMTSRVQKTIKPA